MPNSIVMHTIKLANHQLTYHIIYQKKRTTLQLKILSSTHLQITAPNSFSQTSIEKILQEKGKWIIKKIEHLKEIAANPLNKAIIHGGTILYLGQAYTLVFTNLPGVKPTIQLEDQEIFINIPPVIAEQRTILPETVLRQWYVDNAYTRLSAQTLQWATKINVHPQRMTIKEQKTRWGSCSSTGNINYNWRIIMAPPAVIDYLVIHELCHLHVPNHSALFWQEVGKFSPGWKQHRTWLKDNGKILMDILKSN